MACSPGDVIDRFTLVRRLGSGGMCDVFLALDGSNARSVALKILATERVTDPRALARFRQEGALAASIAHPNVASFVAAGEDRGIHFIACEFVPGLSLAELISRQTGPLPTDLALSILHDLTLGLVAAHQRGVVHCDLKPQNVMLTDDDRIKLIDFGIATRSGEALHRGHEAGVGDDLDDDEGDVLGTTVYAAPEQNQGQEVDTYTDVYALGLLAVEMLTGRRVLQAGPLRQVVLQQLTLPDRLPPLSTLNPASPPALDDLVRSMLSPTPGDRPPSAVDVLTALTPILPPPGPGDGARWKVKEASLLEAADSYYWAAVNAVHEGRFLDALLDFDRLLRLGSGRLGGHDGTVRRELLHLFWRLHGRYRDESGGGLDLDTYVLALQRLAGIFDLLAWDAMLPALDRRLSLLLRDAPDDACRLRILRSVFANVPFMRRSVAAMADYVEVCRRHGATSEGVGILGALAANAEFEGLLDTAAFLYGQARDQGGDPTTLEAALSCLDEMAATRDAEAALLVQSLAGDGADSSVGRALGWCRRNPGVSRVLEAVVARLGTSSSVDEASRERLREASLSLARLYLISEDLPRARRNAGRVLERADARDLDALALLHETLLWQGVVVEDSPSFREMTSRLYRAAALPRAAIAELERDLTGGPEDLAVLGAILRLADEHGIDVDRGDCHFRMGASALRGGRVEDARRFFRHALDGAADPSRMVVRFQSVPGIGRVFTRREILDYLRTRHGPTP